MNTSGDDNYQLHVLIVWQGVLRIRKEAVHALKPARSVSWLFVNLIVISKDGNITHDFPKYCEEYRCQQAYR